MRRRTFLLGAGYGGVAGAAGLSAWRRWRPAQVEPVVHLPGLREGHALRDAPRWPVHADAAPVGVAILGSGAAGLACAWALARAGRTDFVVLSGPEADGNLAGADLAQGRPGFAGDDLRAPLGAHYLPLPGLDALHVRQILQDTGVLLDGVEATHPRYDEAAILHAPSERVLVNGYWDGNLPGQHGLDARERTQQQRFFALTAQLRGQRGRDGRRLFAIPLALSSQDPQWRALDRETFDQWLDRHGYDAPALRWYLDYACRDDYGAGSATVSAWAGLHYFASRDGHAANAGDEAVLTWPGGLSELAARLRAAITRRLGHARWQVPGFATALHDTPGGATVQCAQLHEGSLRSWAWRCGQVVAAMPLHVLARVWPGLATAGDAGGQALPHAAWLVSNFLMDGYPEEQPGEVLAWDNVVQGGKGLGYVVSTHQLLRVAPSPRTVFTAYQALDRLGDPQQARAWLMRASPEELRAEAACDLLAAYGPALWRHARALEITVRGHAMSTPVPGFLDHPRLAALRALDGPVRIAHADLTGCSIFEEAAWWGVSAARALL